MENLTRTAAIDGAEPILVTVECSTTSGFAGLHLVGNTSDMCRDGKERAKTALEKLGLRFGQKRILINLSPADCRKEGNHFDLPIAVSLATLARDEALHEDPSQWLFAAELSLEGLLRPTRAVVPMLLKAKQCGLKGLVVAGSLRREVAAMKKLSIFNESFRIMFFDTLKEVLSWLYEGQAPKPPSITAADDACETTATFDDMYLSPELEKLALVAAAGRHSLLLRGTPGSGKSMFAQRLASLLPPLSPSVHLQALQIHSLVEERLPQGLMRGKSPFRHPHHAASAQAVIGSAQQPGDISLAHGGILFLDELPEFRRDLLEALREPLEQGFVQVSRVQRKTLWPASVQLIAACNNCPCGWNGSRVRSCRCSSQKLILYRQRLSGPVLDRIDLHFNMPELSFSEWRQFTLSRPEHSSESLQKKVVAAREFAEQRQGGWGVDHNAALPSDLITQALGLPEATLAQILRKLDALRLSNRAALRTLRVARTLADLEEIRSVSLQHVEQALQWQHQSAARARGDIMESI